MVVLQIGQWLEIQGIRSPTENMNMLWEKVLGIVSNPKR